MNDLNDLENQLGSWVPRRPSRKLRAKLFPHAADISHAGYFFWDWLVPAVGCLIIAFAALTNGHRSHPFVRPASADSFLASAGFSNQAMIFAGSREKYFKRNGLPKRTIEWTNPAKASPKPAPSGFHSISGWLTNSLVR